MRKLLFIAAIAIATPAYAQQSDSRLGAPTGGHYEQRAEQFGHHGRFEHGDRHEWGPDRHDERGEHHGFYGHHVGRYWHGRYWNYGVGHCWEYDPYTGEYVWVCD